MNGDAPTHDPCEALTIKQVADLLHVSRPTVEKWIKSGDLPSLELGGCRRIFRTDRNTLMARRRTRDWRPLRGKRPDNGQPPPSGRGYLSYEEEIPF